MAIGMSSGGQEYNAPTVGTEVAMGGMSAMGIDTPLPFRMMEHMPRFATSAGFSAFRGSNTLIRGGFLDEPKRFAKSRAAKYRIMQGGQVSGVNSAQYFGGGGIGRGRGLLGRRASRIAQAGMADASNVKAGFLRSSRVNNLSARPRALGRFHSLSVFSEDAGMYTPFGAASMIGRNKTVKKYVTKKFGINDPGADKSVFGPGLFSGISAGRKADILEAKAAGKGRGAARAAKKLEKVQSNIKALAGMNNAGTGLANPGLLGKQPVFGTVRQDLTKAFRAPKGGVYIDDVFYKGGTFLPGGGAQIEGVTAASRYRVKAGKTVTFNGKTYHGQMPGGGGGNFFPKAGRYVDHQMIVGTSASVYDSALANAARGMHGNLLASSLPGEGTRYIAGYFRGAMGHSQVAGLEGAAKVGAEKAAAHLVGKGGTKFMAQGARALGFALPGINMLMAASMVYDLGKMAGEVVKSGINLARDANKSLQGDIAKPLFGMGYKDTEAAATSRARGVMAIQNSRLNARSMLGSEGAMMAARYG